MPEPLSEKVHWFSIINSLLIVVFLSFLMAMILVRSVFGDISRYNQRGDEIKPMTQEQKVERTFKST